MAWVRYDDNFYSNPKVTAVVHEDPGALALHVLANTWTNGQKMPGFVPAHQPALLVCDRPLGTKWAEVLVRSGLWHERGGECGECGEEYAHLPEGSVGFVFHNAKEYRAPSRDRTTAGVSAELSEKRRAAGRKGGLASAQRRKQDEAEQQQAKEATQASASNGQASGEAKPEQAAMASPAHVGDLITEGGVAHPSPAEMRPEAGGGNPSNLLLAGVTPVPVPVPTTEHPSDVLFAAPPAAAPTTKTSKTRADRNGTRIPDDFALSEGMRNWASDKMPYIDPERETEKFINFWQGKSGKDAAKKDWNAAWRYWMLNAAERYPTNSGHRGGYPDRNGVARRDQQPRRSTAEQRASDAFALGDEIDAALANGGRR